MLVQLLLAGCAPSEPPCGKGWDRERYAEDLAEAVCSAVEACYYADYGPVYVGPDHAGCVLHAQQEIGEALASSERVGCERFDACEAEENVSAIEELSLTCDGSIWWAYDYCAMP